MWSFHGATTHPGRSQIASPDATGWTVSLPLRVSGSLAACTTSSHVRHSVSAASLLMSVRAASLADIHVPRYGRRGRVTRLNASCLPQPRRVTWSVLVGDYCTRKALKRKHSSVTRRHCDGPMIGAAVPCRWNCIGSAYISGKSHSATLVPSASSTRLLRASSCCVSLAFPRIFHTCMCAWLA